MKISLEELSKIAGNFLYLLEKEGIEKTDDLEKRIGTTIKLEKSNDFIVITTRPSNYSTLAYTISYHRSELGIPFELKINKQLGYSHVFIKSEEELKDYTTFHFDYYNNYMQNRIFKSSEFSEVKEELKRICDICIKK